jgi:hypothetical protein
MNPPLPQPISISIGLALPNSAVQSTGLVSDSASTPIGEVMSWCFVCIVAS